MSQIDDGQWHSGTDLIVQSYHDLHDYGQLLENIAVDIGQYVETHLWPAEHTSLDHLDPATPQMGPHLVGGMEGSMLTDSGSHVDGNPDHSLPFWHYQQYSNTCGVVSQGSIIEELTGRPISETGLAQEAANHGWYTPGPGGGTPIGQIGNLLEAYGIPVQKSSGGTVEDLAEHLNHGEKIIVGVNGEMIWNQGQSGSLSLADYFGAPEQHADHAVEVIGIDRTDPNNPQVILNDSGSPEGQGEHIPLDVFLQSWATSGEYMVSTTGPSDSVPAHDTAPAQDTAAVPDTVAVPDTAPVPDTVAVPDTAPAPSDGATDDAYHQEAPDSDSTINFTWSSSNDNSDDNSSSDSDSAPPTDNDAWTISYTVQSA